MKKIMFDVRLISPGPDGIPQVYFVQDGILPKNKVNLYFEGQTGNVRDIQEGFKKIRKQLDIYEKVLLEND